MNGSNNKSYQNTSERVRTSAGELSKKRAGNFARAFRGDVFLSSELYLRPAPPLCHSFSVSPRGNQSRV